MTEHVHAVHPEPDMVQLLTPEGERHANERDVEELCLVDAHHAVAVLNAREHLGWFNDLDRAHGGPAT